MLSKIKIHYILVVLFTYIFIFINSANAKKYSEINVVGNERLTIETIVMFSGLNLDNDINDQDLNQAIKKLFQTNYFKDIKIFTKNDIIQFEIIENPIIQSIKINGIKNKSLVSKLTEITKKSEKYPFLQQNIKLQKNLLLNVLRGSGFYFADVEVKIIDNQNTVSSLDQFLETEELNRK